MKPTIINNTPERFDFVFVGATFLSSGAAVMLDGMGYRCLITDRLALPGHEFASAMKDRPSPSPQSAEARDLLDELVRRGAANADGRLHFAALTPVLCERIEQSKVVFYPFSNVISASRADGSLTLKLFCHGSECFVSTGCLVDTTNDFEVGALFGKKSEKRCRLNAAVISDGTAPSDSRIFPACYPDDLILSIEKKGDRHGTEALLKAAKECGVKIITPADEDDETVLDGEGFVFDGVFRAASAAYPNAVAAYDAGVRLASELAKGKNSTACLPPALPPENTGKFDLIIVGLGTAGAICAISAARQGLRVLGIEKLNTAGGTGTAGAVFSYYLGTHGGSYTQLDSQASELQKTAVVTERGNGAVSKAFALEAALAEVGAVCEFSSDFVGVLTPDGRKTEIVGVRYQKHGKLCEAFAENVVDATGDATVCLSAGCEMLGGREFDGEYQIFSSVTRLYNRKTGVSGGKYADDGRVNQYCPSDFGRAVVASFLSPLHLPESYEKTSHRRLGAAVLPGIREGKKIVGIDTVTLDRLDCADTAAFYEYVNLDNHGKDTAFEDRPFRNLIEVCSLWDARIAIPVPFGALIPKGFDRLIAVGRCISVDHTVSFAVRMKAAMQKSGEAGAILAVLSKRLGMPPASLPDSLLRCSALNHGILSPDFLPHTDYRLDDGTYGEYRLPETPDRLCRELSSDTAGKAIFEASDKPELRPLLEEFCRRDGRLALNAALSLALTGNCPSEAEAVICRAITDKSGQTPQSSYTFCFPYAVAAMSAAGCAGIESAAEMLCRIVADPHYADDIPFTPTENGKTGLFYCRSDLRFVYFSVALSSLYEIVKRHPNLGDNIAPALSRLNRDELPAEVSLIGQPNGKRSDLSAQINRMLDEMINNNILKGNDYENPENPNRNGSGIVVLPRTVRL